MGNVTPQRQPGYHCDFPCGQHHVRMEPGSWVCQCGRAQEIVWGAVYMAIDAAVEECERK